MCTENLYADVVMDQAFAAIWAITHGCVYRKPHASSQNVQCVQLCTSTKPPSAIRDLGAGKIADPDNAGMGGNHRQKRANDHDRR